MKRRVMYIHTVSGKPAYFAAAKDGPWGMLFIASSQRPAVLVESMDALKAEQKRARRTRIKLHGLPDPIADFGHIKVVVPK